MLAATSIPLRFADGSVATISYATDGSSRFPKETLDVVADGRNGRLDNFQRITVWSTKGKVGHRVFAGQDKGQRTSWSALYTPCVPEQMPIPLESLVATTRDGRRGKQSVVRKAGYLVSRPSAGWYIRRLRGMSPTEIFYRALDAGRRQDLGTSSSPSWRPVGLPPGVLGERTFASPLPASAREGVDPDAASASIRVAEEVLAGTWTVLGTRVPTAPTRTGFTTRSQGAERPTDNWRSASNSGTRPRRATSSRFGRCRGIIRSPFWRPPGG